MKRPAWLMALGLAAACALVPTHPLLAAPVTIEEVLALKQAGVGDTVVRQVIEESGYVGSLTVGEIIRLKEAGASDELLSFLLGFSPDATRDDGVTVAEEDGVLVVRGRGEPEAPGTDPPPSSEAPGYHEGPAWQAPPPIIVNVPPPPPPVVIGADHVEPSLTENPFPTGAVFGGTGGAVWIPAHHGSDSSFGKTVITQAAWGGYPTAWPSCGPGPVVAQPIAGAAFLNGCSTSRTIPIHTSRGVIWVPN